MDLVMAFADEARARLDLLAGEQLPLIRRAGTLIAATVRAGGVLHAYGTGHSEAVALEVAGRAGGLIPTNRLTLRDPVVLGSADPGAFDPLAERDPLTAHQVLALHTVEPSDAFLIASNSGGNGSTVEMARLVKERGLPLIAITSLAHSTAITSRHPSGERLFELADIVIDNLAPYGDAVLPTEHGPVCGISSITSALIVQLMVAEAIGELRSDGAVPPVYLSANIPGADAHNDALVARYAGRIRTGAL
ncbi:sugar isomerase domain-containing protein [Nonomuraea spiralis]|uniref:Sugar isomerase domain-containing protein n=1 Tax=Nonomuraea spiralis TaxID=46182 RepID=A0ABV5I6T2_9ACTN|nr:MULTISPECIES: SIS domain-containing protein [Nonomuraea]RSM97093.1 sugar isomerase [Nonomuraea sp. WAC 01424]